MSVHSAVRARLGGAAGEDAAARLPDRLKLDRSSVHGRLLRRLAAPRTAFPGGAARAGAGGTGGPPSPGQRVVVAPAANAPNRAGRLVLEVAGCRGHLLAAAHGRAVA